MDITKEIQNLINYKKNKVVSDSLPLPSTSSSSSSSVTVTSTADLSDNITNIEAKNVDSSLLSTPSPFQLHGSTPDKLKIFTNTNDNINTTIKSQPTTLPSVTAVITDTDGRDGINNLIALSIQGSSSPLSVLVVTVKDILLTVTNELKEKMSRNNGNENKEINNEKIVNENTDTTTNTKTAITTDITIENEWLSTLVTSLESLLDPVLLRENIKSLAERTLYGAR